MIAIVAGGAVLSWPPLRLISRLIVEGARLRRPAMKRIEWPAASERDISSRSARVNANLDCRHSAGQRIEVRLDSPTGLKVGELTVAGTGSYTQQQWQSTSIQQVTGVRDLFLVVNGTYGAGDIDKFKFSATPPTTPPGPPTSSPPLSYAGQAVVEIRDVAITVASGHCISITGAQTQVIIDNVDLSACGGHGIYITNSMNVSITNSNIHDLKPTISNQNRDADGIHARGVTGLTIENNRFAEIYTTNAGKSDVTHQDKFAVAIRAGASSNINVQRNDFKRVGTAFYAILGSTGVNFSHNSGENMQGPFRAAKWRSLMMCKAVAIVSPVIASITPGRTKPKTTLIFIKQQVFPMIPFWSHTTESEEEVRH